MVKSVLTRLAIVFILLFWGTMMALLGRQLLFPPELGGRTIPASEIIRKFINQEDALTSLQVYHRDKYLGDANLMSRMPGSLGPGTSEIILTSNLVTDIPNIEGPQDVTFHAAAKMRNLDLVEVFVANLRLPLLDFEARGEFDTTEEAPSFIATLGEEVVLSSDPTRGPTLADLPMASALGLDPATILSSVKSETAEGKMPEGREGSLPFAGRPRPVVILPLIEKSGTGRHAKRGGPTLYFTPEGALVKIVLGGGYELRSLQMAGES